MLALSVVFLAMMETLLSAMLGSTVIQVFLVLYQTLCQQKHLHRQGTSLLLQYLPHHQLLHVVGVNVEMAFVPRLAGVAQHGDIVEPELNIVLDVTFMAMRTKNKVKAQSTSSFLHSDCR